MMGDDKREFVAIVGKDGKLPLNIQYAIQSALTRCTGKVVSIVVGVYQKTRTGAQNRFFHGPFMDAVVKMYEDRGNTSDSEQIKHQLKVLFGLWEKTYDLQGNAHEYLVSTTKYTTVQIEDFMTKIRKWAADFTEGEVQLPFPNEEAQRDL